MKIRRYFKIKKGDSLISSNIDKKLFLVKTINNKLKVYKGGVLINIIDGSMLSLYRKYSTHYMDDGNIIVVNTDSGFIDEIDNPIYYGNETIFYKKDDYIYEVNSISRKEEKRFYSYGSFFEYLPIKDKGKNGLIITKKTIVDDHIVINIYSLNIKEPIFSYVANSMEYKNCIFYTTADVDPSSDDLYIILKKTTRRYSDIKILTCIKFEKVFNPVPFKGEYK